VHSRLLLPLVLCSLLLLGGCWNGRVLLFFEQPYWTSLGDDRPLRIRLERQALRDGYYPSLVIPAETEDPLTGLARDLSRRDFPAAIVSPLVSLTAVDLARRFPGTIFLLLGGARRDDLPPNCIQILFDRSSAFRTAGFAAGQAVREEDPNAGAEALVAKVAVLELSSLAADGEAGAFQAGVAEALDGAQPAARTVTEPVDRSAVQNTLQQMRRDGAEIFLLHLGALDAYGLQVLQDAGGSAVVADWESSQTNPRAVFLSVEEDVPDAIAAALRTLKRPADGRSVAGPTNTGVSASRVLFGPVHLAVGKARPVPQAAVGRVEAR